MDQMASCLFCGVALWKETNGGGIKCVVYLAMTPCELQCASGLWTRNKTQTHKANSCISCDGGGGDDMVGGWGGVGKP